MGSNASAYTSNDAPKMLGKTVLITGANTGIGYHTAEYLGKLGAHVMIGVRNKEKGEEAIKKLNTKMTVGSYELAVVDVSSLDSIKEFAATMNQLDKAIDVLINNAGIMALPKREESKDGFELQLATNCVGPYALTLSLLPALRRAPSPRVVNLASVAAKNYKRPDMDPIEFKREPPYKYDAWTVYNETKMFNLFLTNELARRCPDITSVAAHPGVSATGLFKHSMWWLTWAFQKPEVGALASLRAATEENAKSGTYYGSKGNSGPPEIIDMPHPANDEELSQKYWTAMEAATGLKILDSPTKKK